MVDPDRLHRILQRLRADLAVLDRYREDPVGVRTDPARLGHLKYLFITAIEGVVDAAQHVCASEDLGAPDTNADAVRLLVPAGMLDVDLAQRLAKAVGFRNLLVHGYAIVDDDRTVAHLDDVDDLRAFADALTTLL